MNTIDVVPPVSPTMDRALYLLRQEIYNYLDTAEHFSDLDPWKDEDAALIRELVPTLTSIIRGVVAMHRHDESRKCTACDQPWPCSVANYVHAALHDPERVHFQLMTRLNGDR
ncbi:MAG TPA: hypothetical protein VG317_01775 [Pseudonocardiaceae bacterium]|jgi:hypothetical protein|nr:hypothetical protein [Pseudonocardiaceae bacterium]